MDKGLILICIRTVESCLKTIFQALDEEDRQLALKAIIVIEQELAFLRGRCKTRATDYLHK